MHDTTCIAKYLEASTRPDVSDHAVGKSVDFKFDFAALKNKFKYTDTIPMHAELGKRAEALSES